MANENRIQAHPTGGVPVGDAPKEVPAWSATGIEDQRPWRQRIGEAVDGVEHLVGVGRLVFMSVLGVGGDGHRDRVGPRCLLRDLGGRFEPETFDGIWACASLN